MLALSRLPTIGVDGAVFGRLETSTVEGLSWKS